MKLMLCVLLTLRHFNAIINIINLYLYHAFETNLLVHKNNSLLLIICKLYFINIQIKKLFGYQFHQQILLCVNYNIIFVSVFVSQCLQFSKLSFMTIVELIRVICINIAKKLCRTSNNEIVKVLENVNISNCLRNRTIFIYYYQHTPLCRFLIVDRIS